MKKSEKYLFLFSDVLINLKNSVFYRRKQVFVLNFKILEKFHKSKDKICIGDKHVRHPRIFLSLTNDLPNPHPLV
jgi:hypothetical protein